LGPRAYWQLDYLLPENFEEIVGVAPVDI
jgi:hypothetical protein